LGRNPARIIPAWRAFLDDHSAQGRPARGIGEPIWAGRRPEEVAESQLHEALLNVAVEPDTPFWLICPYDVSRLDPEVIEEAYRSHPAVVTGAEYRGSHLYGGRAHVDLVFSSELPELDGRLDEVTFSMTDVHQLAPFVTRIATLAGAKPDKSADLALAVQELAASSLQRGARAGQVRILTRNDALICEVKDEVVVHDPMTGRKATPKTQRTGLWIANQLCDLVQLRSTANGTTVRVHHWL
ncbi:MAG: sensor histidine kinase, partial [Propionibacteriaceae bacterium]